jgi:predicted DNA-binding ribbon-helix-helix protein
MTGAQPEANWLKDYHYYAVRTDERHESSLVSRNITVLGHRTSVRLEPEMWNAIKDIAQRERCTVNELCSLIQLRKLEATSLTAAIRVFLMLYYRAATTEDGHDRAKHGCFDNMKRRAKILEENECGKARMPNGDNGMSDNNQDEFYGVKDITNSF